MDSEIQKEVQSLVALILQDTEDSPELVTLLSTPPETETADSALNDEQNYSDPPENKKTPFQISGRNNFV